MHTVLVWDADGAPPAGDWTIVLWRAFALEGDAGVQSLPALVEEHAGDLRARFLGWIHDLGEARVRGRRLIEHLELTPGFSYWWMTTLSHTPNYYDAPAITDAIKCLAFEDLCRGRQVSAVRLVTANPELVTVLHAFCAARQVGFTSDAPARAQSRPQARPSGGARRVAGLARKAWRQARAVFRPLPAVPQSASTLCFFDLLLYLEPGAARDGTFRSRYWGDLVDAVEQSGAGARWVHIFYPHDDVPDAESADDLLARFNAGAQSCHVLLDGWLTAGRSAAALAMYARLVAAALRLRGIAAHFTPRGSQLNFWPFFARNWYASLVGPSALRNCQRVVLYATILRELPHQATGVFIQENQPWEMALVHAWRRAGHGRLIGVPHTTVRFWDLRYFYDPRAYAAAGAFDLPQPDLVAVNGLMALRAYREGGYPDSRLREVEALRFGHLTAALAAGPARVASQSGRPRRVLVCGDNIPGSNDKLLRVLEGAAALLPTGTTFTLKPHHAAPFDPSGYPGVHVEIRNEPLAAMLDACDIAVTGNVTSAAADAYCRRVPVAILLDPGSLNGSPLRGVPGVAHFSRPAELAAIIASASAPDGPPEPLFHLDSALPRWRALLGLGDEDIAA